MIDQTDLTFILVGFLAQMVDGALGMAFGVISSSVMIATGVSPAMASASVHAAEIVTTGLSGASHIYNKNVDRALFLKLMIGGVLGGVTGAYILTTLPGEIVKPLVSIYLCVMAAFILYRVFRKVMPMDTSKNGVRVLGFAGGFLDAIGGGGWGPVVVSTLIARGNSPRHTIGSVNVAEFFVTLSISIAFMLSMPWDYLKIAVWLVIGGAFAAPIAGYMSRKLPARVLMTLVGLVVLSLSAWHLYDLFRAI